MHAFSMYAPGDRVVAGRRDKLKLKSIHSMLLFKRALCHLSINSMDSIL